MTARWFSYDPDTGFDVHDTEQAAQLAAEECIEYYREQAGDGWNENVESICWGVISQEAVRVSSVPVKLVDDPRARADFERRKFETIDDYALRPLEVSERLKVLRDIAAECRRQDDKWGTERDFADVGPDIRCPDERGLAELRSEYDAAFTKGRGSWAHILIEEVAEVLEAAGDDEHLRNELEQVAAVCVQWMQAIDRRRKS